MSDVTPATAGQRLEDPARGGDGFKALSAALAPFGWEVTEAFASEYHQNVWVYNLANAVVALTNEIGRLRSESTTP